MKISMIFLISFLLAMSVSAQSAASGGRLEMTPKSQITQVTVYGDRAQVERKVTVDLPSGGARIIFESLPDATDGSSLQVRAQGNAILEDILFQVKYVSEIPDERIRALAVAKEEKDRKVRVLADALARSQGEKGVLSKVIDKVTSVKEGGSAELSPEKWMSMLKFYGERLAVLDEAIRGFELEQGQARAESQALKRQLDELQAGRQKKKNQAVLVVNAVKPGPVDFFLTYMVKGPSWSPVYDLRVDSQKNTLELSYHAFLVQNTGEDWSEVSLKLSTARVEVGGRQPVLNPWKLSLVDNRYYGNLDAAPAPARESMRAEVQMYNVMPTDALMDSPSGPGARGDEMIRPEAIAQSGASAVVFIVPGKNTIDSDNDRHRVSLTTKTFPAVFRYSATPKLSPLVYLKAKVKNSSDFSLLPGKTKIYLDGNFVAESTQDFVAPQEEFWTFLGVDESIKVELRQVKRIQSEEGLIGKSRRILWEYETLVTNNRASPSEIVIWDQLPIPGDKKITVKLLEPLLDSSKVNVKKDSQERLEWLLNLAPGEKKKLTFSFYVEHPLELNLNGLNM